MISWKRHRKWLAAAAIVLAIAMTAGACLYVLAQTAAGSPRMTIVIDAGHGGIDGGVVGRETGVKESDLNLSLSRLLQTEFEEAGFLVVQTRPTEAGLYGAATAGYKRRDMERRAEIIRGSAPAAVISVHQNFFSLTSRRGAQVFFREGNELSRARAKRSQAIIMSSTVPAMRPSSSNAVFCPTPRMKRSSSPRHTAAVLPRRSARGRSLFWRRPPPRRHHFLDFPARA